MVMTGRYQVQPKTVIIRCEDYPGMELVMRGVPVGKIMDLLGLADDFQAGKSDAEQTAQLFTMFADRLVSWNLDGEDGKPVPADLTGVRSLDSAMFMAMFEGWFQGLMAAPKPQRTPSPNGAEVSLPMAVLPANPPN